MRKSLIFAVLFFVVAGGLAVFLLQGKPGPTGHSTFDESTEKSNEEAAVPSAKPTPEAPPSAVVVQATPETPEKLAHQFSVLDALLRGHNDNDPRLDTELKDLGPLARQKITERYVALPREQLNQRGTLAFLIARNPQSDADVKFLGAILGEPPCLSFADCNQAPAKFDPHHSDTEGKTLAYPQLVVLFNAEKDYRSDDSVRRQRGEGLLREALHSSAPQVVARARTILGGEPNGR